MLLLCILTFNFTPWWRWRCSEVVLCWDTYDSYLRIHKLCWLFFIIILVDKPSDRRERERGQCVEATCCLNSNLNACLTLVCTLPLCFLCFFCLSADQLVWIFLHKKCSTRFLKCPKAAGDGACVYFPLWQNVWENFLSQFFVVLVIMRHVFLPWQDN